VNRTELVQAVIWLDLLAAQAKAEGQKLRAELAADARAEFEEHGTAPTWRIPDVATVAASVSHPSVTVGDHVRFQRWVGRRYPTEIEEILVVRPAWLADFLKRCKVDDLDAVDPDTGEVVPGLTVVPGGEFGGVSIRATGAAKEVFGALAGHGLRRLALEASPAVPVVLAELEETDAADA
jgi:hypothetical protein